MARVKNRLYLATMGERTLAMRVTNNPVGGLQRRPDKGLCMR